MSAAPAIILSRAPAPAPAPAPPSDQSDIKVVTMDMPASSMKGGATRRRRRGRRTAKAEASDDVDTSESVVVEKIQHEPKVVPTPAVPSAPAPTPAAPSAPPAPLATAVILAPAKKKTAKVVLVPKATTPAHRKTYSARRVRVTIDNTAKTLKRRRQVLGRVDAMTEEQLRAAAVAARLSRQDSVAKVPVLLLRQMLKDYQTMKGRFL
jgi:hypothetical protein